MNDGLLWDADLRNPQISKTVNSVTTQFIYDGKDVTQEIKAGVKTNYIRTLSIDEPLTRTNSTTTRHYVADALGSTVALADDTGAMKTTYVYDAFGNDTTMGEASDNPFQYTARENDGTGLHYYRARYYSQEMQRFISEDPIGLLGGNNFYSYVQNAPVNLVDPLGLWWVYQQSTGNMYHYNEMTGESSLEGTGYAGHGNGFNNPNYEPVESTGPLPQGTYTIGRQRDNVTQKGHVLKDSMRLYPSSKNNMYGRDGFLIHDGAFPVKKSSTSSDGCVVMKIEVRNKVEKSGDRALKVVP